MTPSSADRKPEPDSAGVGCMGMLLLLVIAVSNWLIVHELKSIEKQIKAIQRAPATHAEAKP